MVRFLYLIIVIICCRGSAQFIPIAMWDRNKIEFNIDDVTVVEGSNLVFTVSLSRELGTPVTIDFATANNTAFAGTHYASNSGTLTIPAGNLSNTITVTTSDLISVCQDDVGFFVNLSNPSLGEIADGQGEGIIQDDDVPTLSLVAGADVTEGATSTFVANLSESCDNSDVTFEVTTGGGTATAGSDYTTQSSQLYTITSGATSVNVPIVTLQDVIDEPTQSYDVTLANPTRATLVSASASANILDDDPPSDISIADVEVLEGSSVNLVLQLDRPSEFTISFDYSTVDGTALAANSDYTSLNVTGATVPPLSTSFNISVDGLADAAVCEEFEVYTLSFSNWNYATYSQPDPTVKVLDDDLPEVQIATLSQAEGTNFSFAVNLSFACPSNDHSFDYFTSDITTLRSQDYTPTSGSQLISQGTTVGTTIVVPSTSDAAPETNEEFAIGLANFSYCKLASTGFGRGVIIDDDSGSEITVKVVTGSQRTCAMSSAGRVKCWGIKDGLGTGGDNWGDEPGETPVTGGFVDLGSHDGLGVTPHSIKQASVSEDHSCAVLDDDRLKCWGEGGRGALAHGVSSGWLASTMGDNLPYSNIGTHDGLGVTPHTVQKVVTAGQNSEMTCVILDTGKVKCWGGYDPPWDATLGHEVPGRSRYGNSSTEWGDNIPYSALGTHDALGVTPHTATDIALTGGSVCVILDTGQVKCWGQNLSVVAQPGLGDIGDDPGEMGDGLPYIDLGTHDGLGFVEHTAKKIFSSRGAICVILDDDRLKCWGNNDSGLLGQERTGSIGDDPGEMGDNLPYTDLGTHDGLGITPHTVKDISMRGTRAACAILDDDRMKCWGGDWQSGAFAVGSSGNFWGDSPGEMGDNLPYAQLGTGRTAKDVFAWSYQRNHTLVLRDNDTLVVYGENSYGELGIETDVNDWGDSPGEVGDGSAAPNLGAYTVKEFPDGTDSYDAEYSCAIFTNNQMACWGAPKQGGGHSYVHRSIGDDPGEMGASLADLQLPTGRYAIDIWAAERDICVRLDNHEHFCFGKSMGGGDSPSSQGDGITPYAFLSGADQLLVRSHEYDACMLDEFFDLYCWDTTTSFPSNGTPMNFGDNLKVIDFDVGGSHFCAILNDNKLRCWGEASYGRLGYENSTDITAPYPEMPTVDLGSVSYPVKIEATQENTCVLFANEQMKCFGRMSKLTSNNTSDQGDDPGEMGDNLPFIDFGVGRSVKAMFPTDHSDICVRLDNDDLTCFGENGLGWWGGYEPYGQLGNGSTSPVAPPTGSYTAVDLNGDTAAFLKMSESHTCVLTDSNAIKCWGQGFYGAIGSEDTENIGDEPGEMGAALPAVNIIW